MMDLMPVLLILAQGLTLVSSQFAGRFVYSSEAYLMYLDVFTGYSVIFTFEVPGQPPFTDGPYKLRAADGSFTIDFESANGNVSFWYQNIDALYLGQSYQPGDLTDVAVDINGDALSVNFQSEVLELNRIGFDRYPGVFEAVNLDSPAYNVTLEVFDNGRAFLQIRCDDRRTSLEIYNLQEQDEPYVHYTLQWTGRATIEQFLDQVRQVCPSRDVEPGDLSQALFINGDTQDEIYVPLGGERLLLERVSRAYTPLLPLWYDYREPVV
ncbi:hypothetical protein FOZ63_027867 [Perkinsus olseni]|uniref:Uncharacterized protein n=1 Tax=Perkinsus olseni TaxID=32597 RepID=A0A7J6TXL8_PEROL|nr:hypothetical protein FOZ63_027867 [Perkinsus olseni]